MAITAYCKKCGREVEPGDLCPYCGTKLGKTAAHAAWVLERLPAADWMSWNAVMRLLLPAALAVVALALLAEGLSGGAAALERLFRGGFLSTLALLLGAILLAVLLDLTLQGKELVDYVVDSRGVHVTRYLPAPTPLKLLARMKSPRMMDGMDPGAEHPILKIDERDLAWKDVARVQLWPEKCYILFYAPAWWLRIPVRATPFAWADALSFVQDKLGRKKAVSLPESLRKQPEKKTAPRRRRAEAPARVADVPPESAGGAHEEAQTSFFGGAPPDAGL